MVEVNESSDGRKVDVPLDNELQISLSENPTTGFQWVAEDLAKAVCDLVDDQFESGDPSARGSSGMHHWRLRANKKGEGRIVLNYKRSWETKPASKSFTITVRVN